MNFIISSKTLAIALQKTKVMFQKDPQIPIIENYLFQCTSEVLTISYTTLRQTFSVSVYHTSTDTFMFCIDARRLHRFISSLDEQPIKFELIQSTIKIHFNNGSLLMDVDDAINFPKIPHFIPTYNTEIKSGFFLPSLKRMLPAVSTNELRPALTGIQLIFTDKLLTLASTNGHYLFSTEVIGDWSITTIEQLIIPKKSVEHIIMLFNQSEPIAINFNNGFVKFTQGQKTFQSRVIDEIYPDWQKLINVPATKKLTLNRKKLIKMFTKLYPFLNSVTREVRLKINPTEIIFDVKNYDYRIEYQENMQIDDYTGEPINIAFNQRLFLTCLENTTSDNIVIELTEPNRAVFIRPAENLKQLNDVKMLMPTMVSTYDN